MNNWYMKISIYLNGTWFAKSKSYIPSLLEERLKILELYDCGFVRAEAVLSAFDL